MVDLVKIIRFVNFCEIWWNFQDLSDFMIFDEFSKICQILWFLVNFPRFVRFCEFWWIFQDLSDFMILDKFFKICEIFETDQTFQQKRVDEIKIMGSIKLYERLWKLWDQLKLTDKNELMKSKFIGLVKIVMIFIKIMVCRLIFLGSFGLVLTENDLILTENDCWYQQLWHADLYF